MYNAVVVSKLIYGLETVQMPPATMKEVDVFQMRGLRKILGIPPTYIDRSNSNTEVFRKVREDHSMPNILQLSTFLKKRRIALLGYIIREGSRSPKDPAPCLILVPYHPNTVLLEDQGIPERNGPMSPCMKHGIS